MDSRCTRILPSTVPTVGLPCRVPLPRVTYVIYDESLPSLEHSIGFSHYYGTIFRRKDPFEFNL